MQAPIANWGICDTHSISLLYLRTGLLLHYFSYTFYFITYLRTGDLTYLLTHLLTYLRTGGLYLLVTCN